MHPHAHTNTQVHKCAYKKFAHKQRADPNIGSPKKKKKNKNNKNAKKKKKKKNIHGVTLKKQFLIRKGLSCTYIDLVSLIETWYGVALVSRIDEILGLFCKRAL